MRKVEVDPVRMARWWAAAGYVLLVATVVAPVAAMSWTGLVGFAEASLHLSAPLSFLVPLSLDGAALACVAFAVHAVTVGDSATGPRLMVWTFAGASAAANVHHAGAVYDDPAAALFFGAMSIAAVVMFDLVLRRLRRQTLRSVGAIAPPLPRFRVLRWLFWPAETARAYKLAVRFDLSSTREALVAAAVPVPPAADDDLAAVPKREAIEVALRAVHGDVPANGLVRAAVDWLAGRGIEADRSYTYDVARSLGFVKGRKAIDRAADDDKSTAALNGVSS